jgi:hypothetical protein
MKVYTTAPLEDPRDARTAFAHLEEIGYDGGYSFEAKHDPFLPLVLAAEHTSRLRLGTAIAIAFARNPMNLAHLAYGMQVISEGRWDDMAGCIDDQVLEEIAAVGPRREIADRLRVRLEGIADAVSLTHNRDPAPSQWADIVSDLKT